MAASRTAIEPEPVSPWSPHYWARKERVLRQYLADPMLLQRFQSRERLPDGYGIGIDERCIEYPWLVAQLAPGRETLLDAGSTLNHEHILTLPVFKGKRISILTLAPEQNCFWRLGVSYLFHDLRDIPLRDAFYDTVVCVSTLEHVGFDNTFYTGSATPDDARDGDFLTALREMNRVLKVGGSLLLTVPFGRYQQFAEFQQFDRLLLADAVSAFGEARHIAETFYRYSPDGWQIADADACAECEFVEWVTRPRDRWPEGRPVEPDLAAAARAVACVRITKA